MPAAPPLRNCWITEDQRVRAFKISNEELYMDADLNHNRANIRPMLETLFNEGWVPIPEDEYPTEDLDGLVRIWFKPRKWEL